MHKIFSKSLKLTDEEKTDCKVMAEHCDKEDRATRERQLLKWRKLKLMWENFTNTWYDSVAHDWRIWDINDLNNDDTDQDYYDDRINVLRAYLESIIAALSVTVPPVKCYPDDADNALDLTTAKAGDKAAELIYKHNDVALVWLHSLFIYCTEGAVFGYNYSKTDKSYGTYEEELRENVPEEHELINCPICGETIDDRIVEPNETEITIPSTEEEPIIDEMGMSMEPQGELCPHCGELMIPEITRDTQIISKLIKTTKKNKARLCLESFGGLNIKVPLYARKQEECGYLKYCFETHYATAIEIFLNDLDTEDVEKIKGVVGVKGSPYDSYEQWARLSPQYLGEYPDNQVTISYTWVRPSHYNILDDERAEHWRKKAPDGICIAYVNDCQVAVYEEELDKHWTLMYNPLADYVQWEPVGMLLISVQEITNDIISLERQTMEQSIGQTFADPAVLDFNAYGQQEAVPGGIYAAKPKSGKSLADAFHQIKTANLSGEVMPFAQQIQSLGQLVSGALPSLFGGQIEGSETASEYSMSGAQAKQRLQNTWKMFGIWWKTVFGKAIPMFLDNMQVDERNVSRRKDGSFFNVYIRKSELQGKIGDVSLEANEHLPVTWSQRKDVVMQLLLSPNPQIIEMLLAPENLDVVKDAIGLSDFYVTGEDDRTKQYEEINLLLETEPIELPITEEQLLMAETGIPVQPEREPLIEIDAIMDNHIIHFEICKKWAVSEAGRWAKINNQLGYENVLLHAQQHLQALTMGPGLNGDKTGAESPEKSNEAKSKKAAPITGESDVQTVN